MVPEQCLCLGKVNHVSAIGNALARMLVLRLDENVIRREYMNWRVLYGHVVDSFVLYLTHLVTQFRRGVGRNPIFVWARQ